MQRLFQYPTHAFEATWHKGSISVQDVLFFAYTDEGYQVSSGLVSNDTLDWRRLPSSAPLVLWTPPGFFKQDLDAQIDQIPALWQHMKTSGIEPLLQRFANMAMQDWAIEDGAGCVVDLAGGVLTLPALGMDWPVKMCYTALQTVTTRFVVMRSREYQALTTFSFEKRGLSGHEKANIWADSANFFAQYDVDIEEVYRQWNPYAPP